MRKRTINSSKLQKQQLDRRLLVIILILTVLGLITVADASAPQALNFFSDELYFVKQQAVWALVGVILMITISFVNYKVWEKFATYIFFVNLLILIAVLIPGIGTSLLGARRWIFLGPFSFQPSELVKLTLAIYIAKLASRDKQPLAYFLPVVIVAGLIMMQPDLGTTIVILMEALIQIFVSGVGLFYFASAGLLAFVSSVLLIFTSPYRRDRLATFMQSTADPLGSDYHIKQVLLALGSGGLFGVGLGHSRQKYLFLPEAATDSVFAIIGEELGFIGTLVLLLIFSFLILRGIKIALNAPDKFSRVLSVGIIVWIGSQVFLNIGSMVAVIPLTGIPLPFISYGGTSLTMVLIAAGILLNISRYAKKES